MLHRVLENGVKTTMIADLARIAVPTENVLQIVSENLVMQILLNVGRVKNAAFIVVHVL